MAATRNIFESHYDYKMDPKYRVSIPVAFRPQKDDEAVRLQISKEHEQLAVIKVFSLAAFADKFRQIADADLPQAKKNQLEGALRMLSREASINSQGKLTVPKEWAERIGLKADGPVKLAGRGKYFIMCTDETFNRLAELDFNMGDAGLGVL